MGEIDRLSDLPDSLIQHILYFLPTTRDTIRTSVLSKRWRNLWRHVPFLSFHTNLEHIDSVLNQYEGSKLERFCISADIYEYFQKYPHLDHNTIRFALDRDVKELTLQFHHHWSSGDCFRLPEFLFGYVFLVRLKTCYCTFQPTEKVNWMHLKEFRANRCVFPDRAIDNILLGCPLLESLGLKYSDFNRLVIASRTLRKLALVGVKVSYFGISCPKLEEFRLSGLKYERPLVDEGSVLCGTVRLTFNNGEFVVTSDCLKKLVLNDLKINHLEIACPLLEELELLHIRYMKAAKVGNMQTLWHSKGTIPTLLLSNKYVILDYPTCDGIASTLCSFYALEKLVIKLPISDYVIEKNFWSSDANLVNLSISELRIVQIHGLKDTDDYCRAALNFVEFLLENAQMLEKLTVTIEDYCTADFVSDVTRKILSVQWFSRHATVELLHKQKQGWIKEVVSSDGLSLYYILTREIELLR